MDPLTANIAFGSVFAASGGALYKIYRDHESALGEFKKIKHRLEDIETSLHAVKRDTLAFRKRMLAKATSEDLDKKMSKAEKELMTVRAKHRA